MIGRTNGGVGTGALLIKVVGGLTRPENPTYGTVWLETDIPINGWEIYSVVPTWEHVEGHVYLQDAPSTSGEIPNFTMINPAKKPYGFIWERLIGAFQRINGAWLRLNGAVWRDGVWTPFFAATINVTYPAGSTCTATDGVTTMYAPDTSGTWACVVPNAGTWTVMENRNGWTYAAEITQDGQTVNADNSKYYLVKNGVPQVTFTAKAIKCASAWASGATAVAPTISGTVGGYYKVYIKKTSNQPCGTVVTSAAIPIKNSKSLKCEGYKTSRASYGVSVCLWNTQTPTYWADGALALKDLNTAVDVYPIDTTSLQNRNLFIGFGFLTGDTDDSVMYIKNLWLE